MAIDLKRAIGILISCLCLASCLSLLEEDFRKATRVSEVELGAPKVYTRTLTPPAGSASLIIVVPNYRCAPIEDAPVSFTVRGATGILFSERKLLSELTWSYGKESCDAYGYLRSSAAVSASVPGRGEMRIDIKADQTPLTFDVDVSQVKSIPGRKASVWLIYGDRFPGVTIFGDK